MEVIRKVCCLLQNHGRGLRCVSQRMYAENQSVESFMSWKGNKGQRIYGENRPLESFYVTERK